MSINYPHNEESQTILRMHETVRAEAEIYQSTQTDLGMRSTFEKLIKMGIKAAAEHDSEFAAKLDEYHSFRNQLKASDTLAYEAETNI